MSAINGPDTNSVQVADSAEKQAPKTTSPTADAFAPQAGDADAGGLSAAVLVNRRRRLNATIVRLAFGWLCVLLLLAVIGLLANLEWARPKVEQSLAEAFHRPVKLGRISWMLGLNGLAVWTDSLSMNEADGKPFLVAGNSEIGVAIIPLWQKRVLIKHVIFHHPEVFATQLTPGKWNFSDLLVEGPEIRYVEVDDGILHLRNQIKDAQLVGLHDPSVFANTKWSSYDFQDVSLKLVFPRKNQTHPWTFYLTFKLPRQRQGAHYVSDVSLTALCNGPFEGWRLHPCQIDLRADAMNPEDWRPFLQLPPGLDAIFNLKFSGKGVVSDVMSGNLSGSAQHITVSNGSQPVFTAPEASWTAQMSLSAHRFAFDKLKLKVAGITMDAHGAVDNWQQDNPSYSAVVAADLHSLADLSDTSFWKLLPGVGERKQAPELSGAARVELTFQGDATGSSISTSLKANGVPLAQLLSGDSASAAPFLSLFTIQPNAPIEGQINIDKDQTISLNQVKIPANGSTLTIQGTLNVAKKTHDVQISSRDLMLDKFDATKLESQAPPILLSGKIDLDAHLWADAKQQQVAVNAKLKGSSISAGAAVLARGLNGELDFDGSALKFHQVSGSIDNKNGSRGALVIDGNIETTRKAHCDLVIHGKEVDIDQLEAFCRSAHLPLSDAAIQNMAGMAREIEISISGKTEAPQLTLKLTPEDVRYKLAPPSGAVLKPLKITGGQIVFTNNRLDLKDLAVTADTGKLQLSAIFVGAGNDLAPKMMHVKTAGIGVEEVQRYLCSPDIPQSTRTAFARMVEPLQLTSVDGKCFGDLKITVPNASSAPCGLDGAIGFSGLKGKFFPQKIPFDHLTGNINIAANIMQVQDVSFMSGSSHFFVTGDVKNIQQSPQWALQISSQFKPEDIVCWLPQDIGSTIQASSKGTLALAATVNGEGKESRITFSAQVPGSCAMHMSGPQWTLCQPANLPSSAEGTLIAVSGAASSLKFQAVRVTVGDAVLQTSGKYEWSENSDEAANIELWVSTPDAVPAATLVAALLPDIDTTGGSGTIKGSLTFAGTTGSVLTHGDFALQNVSLPAINLKNVDGTLHSPRWSLKGTTREASNRSQLHINIKNATVAGVPLHDLAGTIVLDAGRQPKLTLSDGTARIAGGKVNLSGWFLSDSQQWQLEMGMSQLQIDEFFKDLIEQSGAVTGLADGHISLESKGTAWNQVVSHLQGEGEIAVAKGSVPKVAVLQEKLTQVNLIQQGIFGFNLNNVLQTVLPVKAGKFKEASMTFGIADGVVSIDKVAFIGNDLRLRAAGSWNLLANTLNVDVAGNIPRVASSILPGAVGQVSRSFTIQKAVRVVTFNKLDNLPSVPILGDIGTDEPRAFTFRIGCNLDKPNAMQQSISKSFKWLPNKPNASAHPVPGVLNVSLNQLNGSMH